MTKISSRQELRDCYVYAHYRDGAPVYIGKGSGGRWSRSVSQMSHNPHLQRMWAKDSATGEKRMSRTKLVENLTSAEALAIEIQYIAQIGRLPYGTLVNLTAGGDGVPELDPVTRARIRVARSNYVTSNTTKLKLREANLGKKTSESSKRKQSEALRGKKKSDAHRAAMSESRKRDGVSEACRAAALRANIGRKQSAETKKKRADALRGRLRSPETRAKIGAAVRAAKSKL